MTSKRALFVFLLFFAVSGQTYRLAAATTVGGSLGVSVSVQAGCLVSASAAIHGDSHATPAVSVACTHSTPYRVSLGAGPASQSGTAPNPTRESLPSQASDANAVVVTVTY